MDLCRKGKFLPFFGEVWVQLKVGIWVTMKCERNRINFPGKCGIYFSRKKKKKKKSEIWMCEVGEGEGGVKCRVGSQLKENECGKISASGVLSVFWTCIFAKKLCCNRNAIGKTFPDYIFTTLRLVMVVMGKYITFSFFFWRKMGKYIMVVISNYRFKLKLIIIYHLWFVEKILWNFANITLFLAAGNNIPFIIIEKILWV